MTAADKLKKWCEAHQPTGETSGEVLLREAMVVFGEAVLAKRVNQGMERTRFIRALIAELRGDK